MKKVKHAAQADHFEQIINVGSATAEDFRLLGFNNPKQLTGSNPVELYRTLCKITKTFHDPCVLDVFIATVDFMNGGRPKSWWAFTKQRKKDHTKVVEQMRAKYG